jgi:hypothetical protein
MPRPGSTRESSRRDGLAAGRWRRPGQHQDWTRRRQSSAGEAPGLGASLVVVVPQVFAEDPLEVTAPPDQHPVQTLLPYRPYPSLGEHACVRRLDEVLMTWVPSEANTSSKARVNLPSRSRMRNRDPVAPPRPLHREFPCPLDHPRPIRVARDTGKTNPPRPKFDAEQDGQRRMAHGLNGEEVGGHDRRDLRSKERSPGDRRPSGRGSKPVAQQHRADGGRRHLNPELLQLALDAPVAQ